MVAENPAADGEHHRSMPPHEGLEGEPIGVLATFKELTVA
jgi:hypothetical protein